MLNRFLVKIKSHNLLQGILSSQKLLKYYKRQMISFIENI